MEIHFFGRCGSREVVIASINDIDIADTHASLWLEIVYVYLPDRKKWSKPEAQYMVNEIIDDLNFDGYAPSLNYEIEGHALKIEGNFG